MPTFLPGATCIGDLLPNNGYNLAFYGGARLGFSGKGKFFRTHGFTDVNGLHELAPSLSNASYTSTWGLFDDSLFDIVVEKYEKLQMSGSPFGLVTWSLDTHHPHGLPSASCSDIEYGDGSNKMLNTVHCSDMLIGKLVSRLRGEFIFLKHVYENVGSRGSKEKIGELSYIITHDSCTTNFNKKN